MSKSVILVSLVNAYFECVEHVTNSTFEKEKQKEGKRISWTTLSELDWLGHRYVYEKFLTKACKVSCSGFSSIMKVLMYLTN